MQRFVGLVPFGVFYDPRLDGCPPEAKCLLVAIMALSDDFNRFPGAPHELARSLGLKRDFVARWLPELTGRGLIDVYAPPGRDPGNPVGEVTQPEEYAGMPERKLCDHLRGASDLPGRDGQRPISKRKRMKRSQRYVT